MRGGGLLAEAEEGVWSGWWAGSVDNSCGRMNDGGSNLVGSVRSSPTRDAPSKIKTHVYAYIIVYVHVVKAHVHACTCQTH